MNFLIYATSRESEPCLLGCIHAPSKDADRLERLVSAWREDRRRNFADAEDLDDLILFLSTHGINAREIIYRSIYV